MKNIGVIIIYSINIFSILLLFRNCMCIKKHFKLSSIPYLQQLRITSFFGQLDPQLIVMNVKAFFGDWLAKDLNVQSVELSAMKNVKTC